MKKNKTQMNKSSNLFWLFRRVLWLFFLVFVYGTGTAQIILSGNVMVINNDSHENAEPTSMYISEGTYIHGFPQNKKSERKKKHRNPAFAKTAKTEAKQKNFAYKAEQTFHYYPENHDILITTSPLRTTFVSSNNNNFLKKYMAITAKWSSIDRLYTFFSKIFIKNSNNKIKYFVTDYKVRPPPALFLLKCKNLKC